MPNIDTTAFCQTLPQALYKLCRHLADSKAKAWLVGGSVRDLILGISPHDFDLEAYGLETTALHAALQQFASHEGGQVAYVGRQFGVFKLWIQDAEFDIAMPRSEIKNASGHKGFVINADPNLDIYQASLRRDFTINAMMFDPLHQTFIDHHGGADDLQHKRLKHVSPAFSEDPLRPLRAMQLAARFQLSLDADTAILCQSLLHEAATLPHERIWAEWQKWSHAPHPSYGLRALREMGWLSHQPEIGALIGCPQSVVWHPEGDVWLHTLQVCDQAAKIAVRNKLDRTATEQLIFAALCHDFGKPITTSTNASGDIISPGHSEAGIEPTTAFLSKIGSPKGLIASITPLIRDHITHLHGKATPRAVRRLAHRLEPANIEQWEMLTEADASGRSPAPASRPALAWLQQAIQRQHHQRKPTPLLTGKSLISQGIAPGISMGKLLTQAYEAQLDGQFNDKASAIAWLQHNHTITK